MSALENTPLIWVLPLAILTLALILGPLPIVARGMIRGCAGPQLVHRWFRPVTRGLAFGLLVSVVLAAFLDPSRALFSALFCLLFLLAIIDWQWRWLPVEWTFAVIALGALFLAQAPQPMSVLLQMALPAAALFAMRQAVLWVTGKEAMGIGDIWLVLGLGAFLDLFQCFLLIGIAGFSGLLEVGIRRAFNDNRPATRGVSFGAHMCLIFVIIADF